MSRWRAPASGRKGGEPKEPTMNAPRRLISMPVTLTVTAPSEPVTAAPVAPAERPADPRPPHQHDARAVDASAGPAQPPA
jgi:hypothetical protein